MRSTRFVTGCAVALAFGLAPAGCGGARDDLPREPVSGEVTLEGEPLTKGAILFRPSGGTGPTTDAGGLIRDGSYSISRGEGPVPGSYKVLITEEVDRAPAQAPGGELNLRPEAKTSRISKKYNTQSILVATVKPGEANTFDYELKKSDDPEPSPKPRGRRR